jgi:hypothetical protein
MLFIRDYAAPFTNKGWNATCVIQNQTEGFRLFSQLAGRN